MGNEGVVPGARVVIVVASLVVAIGCWCAFCDDGTGISDVINGAAAVNSSQIPQQLYLCRFG